MSRWFGLLAGGMLLEKGVEIKPKPCKACGKQFTPSRPLQVACDWACAIKLTQDLKAKREAKEHRERKAKAKTRQQWMKEAQAAFNKFIRTRDGKHCISCGKTSTGQIHGGHYRTTKAAPELRFNELNCHSQCAQCNNYLSGNLVSYRKNLLRKIGADMVEWLEGKHEAKHYSIDDLKAIKAKYTLMAKELQKDANDRTSEL